MARPWIASPLFSGLVFSGLVFSGLVVSGLIVSVLGAGCAQRLGSSMPCAAAATEIPAGTIPVVPRCEGACDPSAARTLVYSAHGEPMYAGQALLIHACANTCHSSEVTGTERFGAPFAYDFDMHPIASVEDEPRLEVIRTNHTLVVDQRSLLWGTVADRSMPPGAVGAAEEIAEFAYVVDPADATMDVPLARIGTPEGREILRNWLACGAPFVERTLPCPTDTCEGDTVSALLERAP